MSYMYTRTRGGLGVLPVQTPASMALPRETALLQFNFVDRLAGNAGTGSSSVGVAIFVYRPNRGNYVPASEIGVPYMVTADQFHDGLHVPAGKYRFYPKRMAQTALGFSMVSAGPSVDRTIVGHTYVTIGVGAPSSGTAL
jgi:hypothetical protein